MTNVETLRGPTRTGRQKGPIERAGPVGHIGQIRRIGPLGHIGRIKTYGECKPVGASSPMSLIRPISHGPLVPLVLSLPGVPSDEPQPFENSLTSAVGLMPGHDRPLC